MGIACGPRFTLIRRKALGAVVASNTQPANQTAAAT
jgi:hypothetical protein